MQESPKSKTKIPGIYVKIRKQANFKEYSHVQTGLREPRINYFKAQVI